MNELDRLLAIFGTTHGAANGDVFERVTNAILTGSSQLETTQNTLEQLRNAAQRQADAVQENTEAVRENTTTRPTALSGFAADAVKTAGRLLGGGFAFSPILSGLVGLLGSGRPEPAPALLRYVAPTPFRFQGALPQTPKESILEVDYEQSGLARRVFQSPMQVSIHIQAIDSRSFVDHRDEIARAVREAMLNAHGLNDIVAEL
jgi:hypothetical protein